MVRRVLCVEDKVFLVTGGAAGVGAGIVRALLRENARVNIIWLLKAGVTHVVWENVINAIVIINFKSNQTNGDAWPVKNNVIANSKGFPMLNDNKIKGKVEILWDSECTDISSVAIDQSWPQK